MEAGWHPARGHGRIGQLPPAAGGYQGVPQPHRIWIRSSQATSF